MSQYAIDPELSQRRLRTLVRLLEAEARVQSQRAWNQQPANAQGELDPNEMRQWAQQCTNLLNAPVARKAAKPIEAMTDEELLS